MNIDRRCFLAGSLSVGVAGCSQEQTLSAEIESLPSGGRMVVLGRERRNAPLLLTLADSAEPAPIATRNPIARALYLKGYVACTVDLPGYGSDARAQETANTLNGWLDRIKAGEDLMRNVVRDAMEAVDILAAEGIINRQKIVMHGTSAGGCAAMHIAPHLPACRKVALVAPVISLRSLTEFKDSLLDYPPPPPDKFDGKNFWIGMNEFDPRVSVSDVKQFVANLAKRSIDVVTRFGSQKRHNVAPELLDAASQWLMR